MSEPRIGDWSRLLAARAKAWLEAAPRDAPAPVSAAVTALDAATPFLLWRAGLAATGPATAALRPQGARGDAALWWALIDESSALPDALDLGADGPLFPQSLYDTIEVWTESDLSAAQALWWLARERARPDFRERALNAAAWHIGAVQPDNATNRPWGLAVFLDLWRSRGNEESRLYAATLLHNAEAGAAVRTLLSGELLADAADAAAIMAGE